MRIAHLSDPHFSKTCFHPSQFLSKRWIGNFNQILSRRHAYQTQHLWHLPELLRSLNVEAVFITGDFSTTSQDEEFSEGQRFVHQFKEKGLPTFVVPGNHDCYLRSIQKHKRFYSFFASDSLRDTRVDKAFLGNGWWYIGLDCAVPSPPFCSYGHFLESTEAFLHETLLTIPERDRVIIANHFPLFTTGRPLHDLKRAQALQTLLKQFRQVTLYLHGHDHQHYIVERQGEGFPLVINAGSCAHKPNGLFFLLDLSEEECLVQRLLFREDEHKALSWSIDWQHRYPLTVLR